MEALLDGQSLLRSLTDEFFNSCPMVCRAWLETFAVVKRKAWVVIGRVLAIDIGCPGMSIGNINVLFGIYHVHVHGESVRQAHFLADIEDASDKGRFSHSCLER